MTIVLVCVVVLYGPFLAYLGARWVWRRARARWQELATAARVKAERAHTDAKWPEVEASWALPAHEREEWL